MANEMIVIFHHDERGVVRTWSEIGRLVRCKDCKYFDSGTDEDGKLFFKCLGWVYGGTSEDDFCSHGETGIRKE